MTEAIDHGEWSRVVDSDAVAHGAIAAASIGDIDVVVWRDAEGEPCVMDARCPHQWSHLAAEGFVDGSEIVCTAHFWRFDRSGRGSKLTLAGRRDPKADIAVFPCEEAEGAIWVPSPG